MLRKKRDMENGSINKKMEESLEIMEKTKKGKAMGRG